MAASAQTFFDNVLLQDHQQATRDLIHAEHSVSVARKHASSLGAALHGSDQESNFQDYSDDGYALSMEAAIIAHVDHERIRKWVYGEDDKGIHSKECDARETKTVDLCDNVSVVAEGKDRRRINRWRSMYEELEADAVREYEGRISKS
jgi:hypothetical protein